MERLTERLNGQVWCAGDCTGITDDCECKHLDKMREKLAEYEDLEEQGLLLRLPCKVGTTVYFIDEKIEKKGRKNVSVSFGDVGGVDQITIGGIMKPVYTVCNEKNEWFDFYEEDFGKEVFLTKEEAEKALAELK